MDPHPAASALPPDVLVAHAGFVRRVAFAILRDDADADDATQEALATGLASGPRDPSAARTAAPTFVGIRADARGSFAQRLPVGRYHVALTGVPAASRFTFDLDVGPSGLTRDVIVPGVLVAGTLVDGDTRRPFPVARPGAGPAVCLRRPDEPASPTTLGFPPDERGAFRLLGVPPGRYVVYARPGPGDDREGSSVEIVVPADRDVTGLALDVHVR